MSSSIETSTKLEKEIAEGKIFDNSPKKKPSVSEKNNGNNGNATQNDSSTSSPKKESSQSNEEQKNDSREPNEKEDIEAEELKLLSELSYKSQFHEVEKLIPYGLTFDDVLMIPQYSKVYSRHEIELDTRFSRNVPLRIPLVSSPMDTVTEYDMAVAMARHGGLGIIHRFMSIKDQAEMVTKVKKTEAHVIVRPVSVNPHTKIRTLKEIGKKLNMNTFLVVKEEDCPWIPKLDDLKKFSHMKDDLDSLEKNEGPTLLGIVTRRDINFSENDDNEVSTIMTPREKMVVYDNISADNLPTPVDFINRMRQKRVEKVVLLSGVDKVLGLVCMRDCERKENRPMSNLDPMGRLYVGAAVGAKDDYIERAKALIDAGVDVIVVDVANGHSQLCIDAVKTLKEKFPTTDIVAGSVATGEGAELLIKAGVDGIRCGIGNGSICITRVVTGAGIPQLSALFDVAPICKKYNIPLISDGGNRNSGNMCKALASGASCVMLGRLVAGCEESPSKALYRDGKLLKVYRGMAGFGANVSKSQRMGIAEPGAQTYTPEGVEGYIPYAGPVKDVLTQFVSGIRSGMSYCGAFDLEMLQKKVKFIRMTQSGFRESGVHDIKKI